MALIADGLGEARRQIVRVHPCPCGDRGRRRADGETVFVDDVVRRHVVKGDLVPGVDRLRGCDVELANGDPLACGQWA